MQEWLNWTVSKTVVRATAPWVRIPLSPPFCTNARMGGYVWAAARRAQDFLLAHQRPLLDVEARTNLFEEIPNSFGMFLCSDFFGLVGSK